MWNILIGIIIAIIIWTFNPLAKVSFNSSTRVDKKTQSEVNKVVNDVQQQVDYAHKMQEESASSNEN